MELNLQIFGNGIFLIYCRSETVSLFDFSVFTSITSEHKGSGKKKIIKKRKNGEKIPFSLPFFFVSPEEIPTLVRELSVSLLNDIESSVKINL